MAVEITRLPDEPILISSLSQQIDALTMRSMFMNVAEHANGIDGPIYLIANFQGLTLSFREMALALVEANRGMPGSLNDPRIRPVLVAAHSRVRLMVQTMRRKEFGSVNAPVFDTVDEALCYVRRLMSNLSAPAV